MTKNTKEIKIETPQQFAKRLKIKLNKFYFLEKALSHHSYLNEHSEVLEDNERLEFLGDAILDFIVGEWLYNRFPEMPEGDLTKMRAALVQTNQLADFARKINLGNALRLGRGEDKTGGRLRSSLLCDAFEAFIGALYVEKGIEEVQIFIFPYLERATKDIFKYRKNEDPKSNLQEWSQSLGFPHPKYVTCKTSGPDHLKQFEVQVFINGKPYGKGTSHNIQNAEKEAARKALEKIENKKFKTSI